MGLLTADTPGCSPAAAVAGVASIAAGAALVADGGAWSHCEKRRKAGRKQCPSCRRAWSAEMSRRLDRASRRIANLYLAIDDEHTKRGRAILECCSQWAVWVSPQSARPIPVSHCRQRWCPKCARARGEKWAERVEDLLQERAAAGARPKFVTLTQVSRKGERLSTALQRFNDSWRRLYRCKPYRQRVRGALMCREVTWSKGAWHVHGHALFDCQYWDVRDLSETWKKATGGSNVVWITEAKPGTEREVIKYPMKGLTIPDAMLLREATDALRGARMVSALGEWRGLLSDAELEPVDASTIIDQETGEIVSGGVVSWWSLIYAARRKETWAVKAIDDVWSWFRNKAGPDGEMWFAACVQAGRLRFNVPGLGSVFELIPGGRDLQYRWAREGRVALGMFERWN